MHAIHSFIDLLMMRMGCMSPVWMWLLRNFGIIYKKLTMMSSISTPWLPLIVLFHFLDQYYIQVSRA